MRLDRVWRNARLATLAPAQADQPGLGIVEHGAVAARDGKIVFAGPESELPDRNCEQIDCGGRWITPGLIDCHTHLVHGGHRAREFEQRLAGASYQDIARDGGGIRATMAATRGADETALIAQALPRLDALLAEGVTTIEIKSGYGLSLDSELRQLRAARALGQQRKVQVVPTFLAAHARPPEFPDNDAFIDAVCQAWLPAVAEAGLAECVDAFCEGIAFTPAQTQRVFEAARRLGFKVKLHADQLSDTGGAAMAAGAVALSADHLEYANDSGIAAMAQAGTAAVLLPGAFYTLRERQLPPVQAMRDAGVAIALATDCNPGTAPLTSLLLAMNMGATLFGLTVPECLAAVTRNAARALGRSNGCGTLEPGKSCDLAIWSVDEPAELVYRLGFNPLHQRVWRGV